MRNIIVGTAGHIDHGKTALVKALTGTDADRLSEEKRRGITIDLGFAHLQLTKDIRIGFIDVPGHERFVRNMLAGAAGIDLVLFVIAASESIKPQTREHFEICRLLGVESGVIALTKADLVEPDLLELVRMEVDELTAGSFLETAPCIAVSSLTGEGIPELLDALTAAAKTARGKAASGCFRLPVDRAFTMKGYGTVVTGTLVSGSLARDQEVELHPGGLRLRVRGLQVYGEASGRARAGERTAVNLAGIDHTEIRRGMVLTEPGLFEPVSVLDCRLDLLPSAKPLKHRAPVHFHAGTAETGAEVRLLDRRATLQPGESAWARLRLSEPVLLLPGDHFIIRRFSPVTTIGGGVVVDISGHRYRRGEDAAARLSGLTPAALVAEQPFGLSEQKLTAFTGLRPLPPLPDTERTGNHFIAAEHLVELRLLLTVSCRDFHREHSLLPGIPPHDLKARVMDAAPHELFDFALGGVAGLIREGDVVRLRSHRVILKQDEQQARECILSAFKKAGLAAPAPAEVLKASGVESARARTLLQTLLRDGLLTRVSEEVILPTQALTALRDLLRTHTGESFTVSMFKDWTGVSRKYAIPILEYLDRERLTRREGDLRVAVSQAPGSFPE